MKLRRLFAALFAFALVAAACGGSDGDDDNSGSTDDTTATTATETTDETTATTAPNSDDGDAGAVDGDPVAGGTLVIGSTQVTTPPQRNSAVRLRNRGARHPAQCEPAAVRREL